MFERFTDRARRVLELAQEEALELQHELIGTGEILIGLLREGGGPAAAALEEMGVTLEGVQAGVASRGRTSDSPPTEIAPFSRRSKRALELALRESLRLHHNYIGTEHLLLGLIRQSEGVAVEVLAENGIDLGQLGDRVLEQPVSESDSHRTRPSWNTFHAAVAKELQDDLESRVARLPVRRLRRFSDLMLLQGVEDDHIIRLTKRFGLSDSDHQALQTLWFARVDAVLEPDIERLRQEWATSHVKVSRRVDRLRKIRLGKYHLGSLYWNTFGPGGETWFGDHLPVRRFLFRLRWRP